jgi:hypothetical protein
LEHLDLFLERLEPPDSRGEDDPGPVRVDAEVTRVGERHVGGRHRELGEPVDASHLLGPEPEGRVEVGDAPFAGRGRLLQALPEGVDADAAARQDAHPGDGHAPPRHGSVGSDAEKHQSLAEMRS